MVLSDMVKMRMCKRTHVLNKCVRALPSFQRGVFDFLARFKTPCSRDAYQVVPGVWRCWESTLLPQLSAGLSDFVTLTILPAAGALPQTATGNGWGNEVSHSTKFFDECQRTVHPERKSGFPAATKPRGDTARSVETRQAVKVACSFPTHRPGVGATFLCSWAALWCPSTYFVPYSAQIRY